MTPLAAQHSHPSLSPLTHNNLAANPAANNHTGCQHRYQTGDNALAPRAPPPAETAAMPFTSAPQTTVQVSLKGPQFKQELKGHLQFCLVPHRAMSHSSWYPAGFSYPSADSSQLTSIIQFHLL